MNPYIPITQSTIIEILHIYLSSSLSPFLSILNQILNMSLENTVLRNSFSTSLGVQRLGIRMPMRKTWAGSLVWEDPTCQGAAKPRATTIEAWGFECPSSATTEPACCSYWSLSARKEVLCKKRSHCSLQLEQACVQQGRAKKAKNK